MLYPNMNINPIKIMRAYPEAIGRISSGVLMSLKSVLLSNIPVVEATIDAMMSKKSEFPTVFFTISIFLAPTYCATITVVAIVIPVTSATSTNIMGKLTDTAAKACGPKNLPTHMLSTVL
jgi:hypothetical protein